MTSPRLFLSHAGPDAAEARALKQRLLASPVARDTGLEVWLDLDDLEPGTSWQAQLEVAIGSATCGAILVGHRGLANWVQAEFDLLNSRAVGHPGFRLIPVLLGDTRADRLTPFAKRFQAVRDPLNDDDALARLLGAVLGQDGDAGRPALTDDPFPGLRSMDETWNDRFFGRDDAVALMLGQLRQEPMVSIVADSGAGKSSLAMAGVGAAWRGGAFSPDRPKAGDDIFWNVITMRPRDNPMDGLAMAVTQAAQALNLPTDQCASLRQQLTNGPGEALFALECGLPAGRVRTLLIIDQAEELVTATSPDMRRDFGKFVAEMVSRGAANDRLRAVLTMRADYANVVKGIPGLGDHLRRDTAYLKLGAPAPDDIRSIVEGPLHMAGFRDEDQIAALSDRLTEDLSDRPGDLALAQMALHLVWRDRSAHGGNLLASYSAIGRVFGALGQEAERVAAEELTQHERDMLMPIFIRLVRLGDTAGATRRIARLDEFEAPQRALIDRHAGEDCGRLLQTTETTVEIAHESLITQWPELHDYVRNNAADLRVLGRIMAACDRWLGKQKRRYLAGKVEVDEFWPVYTRHPEWLSGVETRFLTSSRRADRQNRAGLIAIACIVVGLATLAGILFDLANRAQESARVQRTEANIARRTALALYAQANAEKEPQTAIKLALSAWPKDHAPSRTLAASVLAALSAALERTKPHLKVHGHEGLVSSVAFSPDGSRIVTGGGDGNLRLWNAETGAELRVMRGHDDLVRSVAFSPDGTRIASGGDDGTLRLWDAVIGTKLAVMRGSANSVLSVAYSSDGTRIVSGGDDSTLHIWDTATSTELAVKRALEGLVTSVAFSPDGTRIVAGGSDGTLRLWDAATETVLAVMRGHEGAVQSVAFSPDGTRIVSGGWDNTLRLWDTATGDELAVIRGHEDRVQSVGFSLDGSHILSGGWDSSLRLWDAATGGELAVMRGHEDRVWSVAFSPDATRIVSGGDDGTLRLWDAATGDELRVMRGHDDLVRSVAFNPDGTRIVSGGYDRTLRLWDAATGGELAVMRRHLGSVQSVAYNPEGTRIASGGNDNALRIWDAAMRNELAVMREHESAVQSVAFSPDGTRIVSAGWDNTLRLWNAETGTEQMVMRGHENWVQSVAFSPDGTRIVSGGWDNTLRLWNTETGAEQMVMRRHEGNVLSVAFSPDGTRIVSGGSDGTLRLWDSATGTELSVMRGHEDWVRSVAFSPDGMRIVSGGDDSTLRLWDAATGAELAILRGHEGSVRSVAFSPDGTRIVSGGDDSTLRLWDAFSIEGNILQVACQFLPIVDGQRDLSTREIGKEIGISDLDPLTPCEAYDPPLPALGSTD